MTQSKTISENSLIMGDSLPHSTPYLAFIYANEHLQAKFFFFLQALKKHYFLDSNPNKQFKQDMLWKNANKFASGKLFQFSCISFTWQGF